MNRKHDQRKDSTRPAIDRIGYAIVPVAFAFIMTAALASCSSSSPAAPSQPAPAATQSPPSSSAQPPASNSGRSRPGANGTVIQVSGSTITLNTQGGQITVDVLPDAAIQKTVAATVADLQVGETVSVVGSADSNGNIAASRISVRPQSQGLPSFAAPAGASPRPSRTGSPPGGFNRGGNLIFGTISAMNGNEMTVTTPQSQQQTTVTMSSTTTVEKTVIGSISDVQAGDFVSAVGTADQSGNIQATFVTIGSGNASATP